MGERINNVTALFKNGRTRTIILLTMVIVIVTSVFGYYSLRSRINMDVGAASVAQLPVGIDSVPGSFNPTHQYAEIQDKDNKVKAQEALKTGGSSVPTLIRSYHLAENQQGSKQQDGALGFGSLNRVQHDNGNYKKFGNGNGANGNGANGNGANGNGANGNGANGNGRNGNGSNGNGANGSGRNGNGADGSGLDGSGLNGSGADGSGLNGSGMNGAGANGNGNNGNGLDGNGLNGRGGDGNGLNGNGANGNGMNGNGANGNGLDGNGGKGNGLNGNGANGNGMNGNGANGNGLDGNGGKGNGLNGNGANGNALDGNGGKGNGLNGNGANGNGMNGNGANGNALDGNGGNGNGMNGNGANGNGLDGNGANGNGMNGNGANGNGGKGNGLNGDGASGNGMNGNGANGNGLDGNGGKGNGLNGNGANGNGMNGNGANGNALDGNGGKGNGLNGNGANGNGLNGNGANGNGANGNGMNGNGLNDDGTDNSFNRLADDGAGAGTAMLDKLRKQQDARISERERQQLLNQMKQTMSSQASQLFAAWKSSKQLFVQGQASKGAGAGGAAGARGGAGGAGGLGVMVKAGTIYYAVLDTSIDTDEPGPILASIVSGPLKGSRLIGRISTTSSGKRVLLNFSTMTMPTHDSSISISAVAIDPDTSRTTFSDYTNTHLMMRYGMLFASTFLAGFGQAVSQSGSQITLNPLLGVSISQQATLSARQQKQVALGKVGTALAGRLQPIFNTPPTVRVNAGTGMGILFMSDVANVA